MAKKTRISRLLLRIFISFSIRTIFFIRKTLIYKNDIDFVKPCIVAVFHNEIIPMIKLLRHKDFVVMISKNHVGSAVADVVSPWGFKIVHGSPSKGGKLALEKLLEEIKDGNSVALTPDGSRGPRHKMKAGAIILAQRANVPLYLVSPNYKGVKLKFLWDHFLYPLPFSKVTFRHIKMEISSDLNRNQIEQKIVAAEEFLKNITNDSADKLCDKKY
ncbi:MAG: DUF374 domain-containing protein [archaeon]|nr:DUF374 domain-containing protein [archaeon]